MKILFMVLNFLLAMQVVPASAALVTIPGQGMWAPGIIEPNFSLGDSIGATATMSSANASAMIAFGGTVYQQGASGCFSGTKNLSAIKFLPNNISNGSPIGTVRVSIQGQSAAAGPPARPDGVILGGGNAFSTMALNTVTSSTWKQVPTFSAPAVVSCGQNISIVFDWATPGASGQFQTGGSTGFLDPAGWNSPGISTTTDGISWSSSASMPVVMLVFDDGTYGSLSGTIVLSSTQNRVYNTASNPNEYGCSISFPFQATVAGLAFYTSVPSGSATMTVELTDDAASPNVLASVNFDGHQWNKATNNWGYGYVAIPPVTLTKNAKYYLGVKATSATNITFYEFATTSAAEMGVNAFGNTFLEASRNGGSWSADTPTIRPGCQVMITQVNQ